MSPLYSKKAKPSTSKAPVRKAPRIKSSTILQIDGVNCRNDDRKGITAALIRWHWEADDPARPGEKEIVEIATEVEGGLGPEVQFSHPEYPAMLGNVIRKHYRG
jgi:hypothetical protein